MDQIYQDFTTKLLPKVAEGLQITKEYFIELFGRYIHYLRIMDSIKLVVCLILFIMFVYFVPRVWKWLRTCDPGVEIFVGIYFIPIIILFFSIFHYADNLVKDIYIPEIRVMQEITGFQKTK